MGGNVSHQTEMSNNIHYKAYYWAEFEREPFSEGSFRYAFKGKYRGNGPLATYNKDCVTKVFKATHAREFRDWRPELAVSKKAQWFAKRFNNDELYRLTGHPKRRLEFVIPLIARTRKVARYRILGFIPGRRDTRYVLPQEFVAIEPFLEGYYQKFNSNGGYECWENISSLLPAFCHWTWHVSGHKYMVCDLQGVKHQNDYQLTDPAIHSVHQEFGVTDLGVIGMEMVLANHTCNFICTQLGLPQNPMNGVSRPGRRRTSYSHELTNEQRQRNRRGRSNYFQRLPALLE
ncbi:alpha-protein kinase vwkA-like [Acropora millepora]|uniref:alpha-protein kinase vwkA-like n=1 Tax=Acropora millepora TaxID=45264 RepID=UPI001CF3CEF7|nr:alpha-protein kinase vwkA-like [Acropora millepora]